MGQRHRTALGGGPHRKNVNREGGGTPHILPELGDKKGGHRTSKFGLMFLLGWGHRTKFQTFGVGRVGGIW